jgi:hypothetical protein
VVRQAGEIQPHRDGYPDDMVSSQPPAAVVQPITRSADNKGHEPHQILPLLIRDPVIQCDPERPQIRAHALGAICVRFTREIRGCLHQTMPILETQV